MGSGGEQVEKQPVKKAKLSWSARACDIWISGFEGSAPGGRIGKALKPIVDRDGWEAVEPIWIIYCSERDTRFAGPEEFATKWYGLIKRDGEFPKWGKEPHRLYHGGWSDGR